MICPTCRHDPEALEAQLAEAQRERDDHQAEKYSVAQLAAERMAQLQSQAAQLAGMREALSKNPCDPMAHHEGNEFVGWIKCTCYKCRALSTPACEWERRVQGLVDALRGIAMTYDRCNHPTKAGQALAAWEGKAESRQEHASLAVTSMSLASNSDDCADHGIEHSRCGCAGLSSKEST